MNRLKIVAVAVFVVLLSAIFLSGCGKGESTPDEATTSPQTEVTSSVLATTAATQATEKTQTQAAMEEPSPEQSIVSNESSECTINVDGKAYTCYIGDTVNYVFNLKTPEALEDFQAVTNYDSSVLELIDTGLTEMFPVAGSVVVCNTEVPNVVKYNAVNLSGMDFTDGGVLVSLKFKVKDSGGTAIGTTLEYMDSVKSEPYVNDYKIVGDIQYSEEIK